MLLCGTNRARLSYGTVITMVSVNVTILNEGVNLEDLEMRFRCSMTAIRTDGTKEITTALKKKGTPEKISQVFTEAELKTFRALISKAIDANLGPKDIVTKEMLEKDKK
jgi:hypothetical protein